MNFPCNSCFRIIQLKTTTYTIPLLTYLYFLPRKLFLLKMLKKKNVFLICLFLIPFPPTFHDTNSAEQFYSEQQILLV